MKIGIIGAGFTGLAAAYELSKNGHDVTVFEKDSAPGGLAIGYQEKGWEWSVERHYHHWFSNDNSVLDLAREIGFAVLTPRPITSVYVDGSIYQLDSPLKVLKFPKLALVDRIRMAAVLGFLRFDPWWKPLEKIHANSFLSETMGTKPYKMLWEPQLKNKFGQAAKDVSLAWFWARIKKRTPSLVYPEGGFLKFAQKLVQKIEEQNGKIFFNTEILEINDEKIVSVKYKLPDKKNKIEKFDSVIVTTPSFLFLKIAPQLPDSYRKTLGKLKGLGATNMVLRLSKKFFPDKTYWLSICDTGSPIMAIVEHTNFMDKKHYNNEHIVYLGNYLPPTGPNFSKSNEELFKLYDPFLSKINPNYKKTLIDYEVFRAPFAQPIIPVNYSKIMPPFKTPLPHVFLSNIEQVYPWDRGTNYAVELGQKVANLIMNP